MTQLSYAINTDGCAFRDTQVKAIETLLNDAEKYLGQFCTTLASYTRKTAKLRDKADIFVRQLNEFASTEDPELRTCIKNLAEDMAMVQDYRQAEVRPFRTFGMSARRSPHFTVNVEAS